MTNSSVSEAFHWLERYVRDRRYEGYDKFDALMSPSVEALTLGLRWPRFAAVQLVQRSPVDVRRILGVRIARNPKAIGLFLRGYAAIGNRDRVEELATWLVAHRSPGFDHACWGYPFPWSSLYFELPRHYPNAIVTTFAAEGLLDAYRLTGREEWLEAARSAARFLLDLPRLRDDPRELGLAYVPDASGIRMRTAVVNIHSVIAGFLARLSEETRAPAHRIEAGRLIRFAASRQQADGGWFYTDPPGASPIECDNYHTGGILDGFIDYLAVCPDADLDAVYRKGLEFYDRYLFEEDGFPRWERRSKYPGDIHGAAQGIITMMRAGRTARAEMIADWTMRNLWNPAGCFGYQRTRFGVKHVSLMRWCNAWMFRALSLLLSRESAS